MNNPFEVESCILHQRLKRDRRRNNLQTSLDLPAFPIVAESLPDPKIFGSYPTSNSNFNDYTRQTVAVPTIAECTIHLELLEAFLVLKRQVLRSNALDITFNTCRDQSLQLRSDPGWLKIREEKWEKFLDLSVLRFEIWWDHMAPKILRTRESLDSLPLPPLDVLMVWHTYMLNPGLYREDLKKKLGLGTTGDEELQLRGCAKFPWRKIHEAINHYTRAYTMSEEDGKEWRRITEMPDDLFEFLSDYENMHISTREILGRGILETPEGGGEQWVRPEYFSEMVLRPSEKELIQLYVKKDSWCLWRIRTSKDFGWCGYGVSDSFYVSHPEMARSISLIFSTAFIDTSGCFCPPQTLYEFRQKILHVQANNPGFGFRESAAIDWLFETYTRHGYLCGPSMDLKAAVQRQEAFIQKMGNFLWIRSPFLQGTLFRALFRYTRFFELVRLRHNLPATKSIGENHQYGNANTTPPSTPLPVVPTLDIDLVWHTHQLDPTGYYTHCLEKVGKFINHNDDLDPRALQQGWEKTKETYWLKYGEFYSRCLCWTCEGVKNKAAKLISDSLSMPGKKVNWQGEGREVRDEVEYWRKKEIQLRMEK